MKRLQHFLGITIKLTLFFLILSLIHVKMVSPIGGLLSSAQEYYGVGFPLPTLNWKVDYYSLLNNEYMVTEFNGKILSHRFNIVDVLTNKNAYVRFDPLMSSIGFVVNSVFWFITSALLLMLWQLVVKLYGKALAWRITQMSFYLALATILLPTIDVGQHLIIETGKPWAFLKRYHISPGPYSQNFYVEPFMFVLDMLIIWSAVSVFWLIFGKLVGRLRGLKKPGKGN